MAMEKNNWEDEQIENIKFISASSIAIRIQFYKLHNAMVKILSGSLVNYSMDTFGLDSGTGNLMFS